MRRRDPDGIADPEVLELTSVAEQINRGGAHAQELRDLANGQQRANASDRALRSRGNSKCTTFRRGGTKIWGSIGAELR